SPSRSVRKSGISRRMCAFSPISCSKETFDTGRKLCAALSCSLRKYFSTAWRIVSDSATASASLSIRNHVLPSDASQTYLMLPPTSSGTHRHREGGDAMSGDSKIPSSERVNSFLGVVFMRRKRAPPEPRNRGRTSASRLAGALARRGGGRLRRSRARDVGGDRLGVGPFAP